jgi:hypothetical protein
MGVFSRERFSLACGKDWCQSLTFTVHSAENSIRQLACAEAVANLRELDCLSDRGIRRHASHVEQLMDANPQQIEEVSVNARDSATHALREYRVDPSPMTEHSKDQLAKPASVAGIELRCPALE